jgi:hypothetical protein
MEMFNVHRRDIMDFDNYMDLKKPGFGGPSSAKAFRDNSGKKVNKDPRLAEYQRVVNRDPAFSHPVYDPTYKAMTHDLVYKQEKKKPFTYADPYHTGIPVIDVTEGKCAPSFNSFISESYFDEEQYFSPEENEKTEDSQDWNNFLGSEESYGANPMMGGNETRVACRNEEKAEDILLDMKIDWDGWDEAPVGGGKSFTKDGDIVAYFDDSVRPHQLVILPEAETMADEEYNKIMQPDAEMPMDDEEEEEEDEYYKEDEEESDLLSGDEDDDREYEEAPKAEKKSSDVKDLERILKSFETEEEDEDDEY